ncbi:aldo/keto reductase [Caldivirga sp.]|uniref:aldo/keto reductase n=1 Tax=Caldivirga sp. TaxID=2080243 RepID=UPI0025BB57BF|nr:aldo/keto reductase [Caldivirga sp.]
MQYVKLGWSGVKVSQICLGMWHLPPSRVKDEYGVYKVDEEETTRIIKRAIDLGINFIDTANVYHGTMSGPDYIHAGNAERILGNVLKGYDRESLVIATKVRFRMAPWPNGEGLSRKHIRWQIKESLRRLGLEYVDLYQIHAPDPDTPKIETLRTLNYLVEDGLVNYIGESNHPAHDIVEFMELAERRNMEPFVTMQEPYNYIERWIENDKIPVAKRYGMAILAYIPLAQGVLTGKYVDFEKKTWRIPEMSRADYIEGMRRRYFTDRNLKILMEFHEVAKELGVSDSQLALAWMLKRSENLGVTIIPIIGATSVKQLEEDLESLNVKINDDVMKRLEDIYKTGTSQ